MSKFSLSEAAAKYNYFRGEQPKIMHGDNLIQDITAIKKIYEKAFGARQKVKDAKYIGSIAPVGTITKENSRKIKHWYVDRRKKRGTAADRKK